MSHRITNPDYAAYAANARQLRAEAMADLVAALASWLRQRMPSGLRARTC